MHRLNTVDICCAIHEKGPCAICRQCRPRSACTFVHADLGLNCPFTESMDIVEYVDEQRMSRLDCMDAHANLDFRCLYMA